MEELTIEQKAQRYDEIIERVDELLHTSDKDSLQRKIESILIALKKNKDERIKDAAIEFIRQNNFFNYRLGISKEEVVAWIEKQCEHAKFINEIQVGDRVTRNRDGVLVNLSQLSRVAKKPIDQDTLIQQRVDALTQLKKQAEQKPVDKIELKFHKGDWIIHQGTENIYQVVAVIDNQYQLKYGDNYTTQYCIDVDRCARLYDVTKDAKDGDVLVNQNGEMPFIFKECKNNHIYCYCGYTNRKDIFFDGFVDNEGEELHWLNLYHEQAYPATKEQRNLLFSKMHEAGYEWDAEHKQLNKIEQKPTRWSDYDECMLTNLIDDPHCSIDIEYVHWFKELKERYTWKPSDEQLHYLYWIANIKLGDSVVEQEVSKHLNELYKDLKKLKG